MYANAIGGVELDYKKTMMYLYKSAKQGDSLAQFAIGLLFFSFKMSFILTTNYLFE